MSAPSTARRRRRRAWALVAALAVALASALALASADRPSVLGEAVHAAVEAGGAGPPACFEDEALRLEGREDLRADERAGVLGFSCEGEAARTLAALEEELCGKGWSGVRGGDGRTESFVKGSGWYRWMLVSCVEVGGWTSVVVRYTTEEGA